LTSLVLSNNQLSGDIPIDISYLNNLTTLRLDANQLSGTIPSFDNLSTLHLENNKFSHQDIATNHNVNSSIGTFTFSPQYYGDEQNPNDDVGREIILKPEPPISYDMPHVRWFKDDGLVRGYNLHDTTYVIPAMDTTDTGIYEYQFIDSTLTPLVEFQSLPIKNRITGLDLENEPIITDELIIDFTNIPEDSISVIQAILADLGGVPIDTCGCDTPLYLYEFDTTDIYAVLDTFGKGESSTVSAGVDGGLNRQQNTLIRPIGGGKYLPEFDELQNYQDNVIIAFLDSGINMDSTHQRIQERLWINPQNSDAPDNCIGGRYGYNFVDKSEDVSDKHGHGTAVGGLIAENIPDEANIQVMPVKVYGDTDTVSTLFHLGCGIHYAIDNGADLINISLGYKGEKSNMLANALQRAKNEGIIVVASAGNDGINIDKEKYWPAGFANADDFDLSNVLTVAALDESRNFWKDSNYGPNTVNFAVRGEKLVVPTLKGHGYLTGTSASAPLTTLALALEMADNKNRSYQTVIESLDNRLRDTTTLIPFVKDGKWLNIVLNQKVLNPDIKVLLEGAAHNDFGYSLDMRTDLHQLNVLPMSADGTRVKHPFGIELNGFSNDEWSDTPRYSPDVVDWVLISLRRDSISGPVFYKTPAWLLRDGTVRFYSPITEPNINFDDLGNFHITVEHRNHLPVITPFPLNKDIVGFNFIEQNSHADGGSGQKEIVPDVWAMYAANMCNHYLGNICGEDLGFEEITGADKGTWSGRNGNFGIYEPSDANLDGDVNGADKILWVPNNGVFSATPR